MDILWPLVVLVGEILTFLTVILLGLGLLAYRLFRRALDQATEINREAAEAMLAVSNLDAAQYVELLREKRRQQAVKGTEHPMKRTRLN